MLILYPYAQTSQKRDNSDVTASDSQPASVEADEEITSAQAATVKGEVK